MVKLPDEPRPVPAGMSAIEVISRLRISHVQQVQRLADDRVLDFVDVSTRSSLEYLTNQLAAQGLVQGDVDVLVDGRGDQEAGVLAVVGGEVGAAAAQGDSQRAASDDHALLRTRGLSEAGESPCVFWGWAEAAYTWPAMSRAAKASSREPDNGVPWSMAVTR